MSSDVPTIYENKYQPIIDEILKTGAVGRHSMFQLKYFIVGKEPTHQSKMWRCLSEIESRNEQIQSIIDETLDLNDQIELTNIKKAKLIKILTNTGVGELSYSTPKLDELEIKELNIKINALDRKINKFSKSKAKIDKKLIEIQEEIMFFTEAYLSLAKKESLKPFDDINSQTEYWNEKISQDLNLRMLLGKPLDIEMIKTALALNEKAPIKQEVLGILEQTKQQISVEKNGR